MNPPASGSRADSPPYSALSGHADFLRRLARGLLGDGHAAEDVVQECWLQALERPPRHEANPAGWSVRVVRRLAGRWRRGEGRRVERERRAARAEALPSALDVTAREELLRCVTDAVLELDEPYRRVVLLRHYEGLDARAIAELTGAPLATVRSRLQRAHARLRERLDAVHGGERGLWCQGLVGLLVDRRLWQTASGGAGATVAQTGALVMGAKAKLAAGVAVVALAGWGAWSALEVEQGGSEAPAVVSAGEGVLPSAKGVRALIESGGSETSIPQAGTRELAASATASTASASLTVLVVAEGTGEPLEGVAVYTRPIGPNARGSKAIEATDTGADGRVALEVETGARLEVTASGMMPNHAPAHPPVAQASVEIEALGPGERREVRVEVQAGRHQLFFARVIDEVSGEPIAGARAVSATDASIFTSDAGGLLELRLASWTRESFVLSADGYGERSFVPLSGHESAREARRLGLLRHAGLKVIVLDESGAELGSPIVRLSARTSDLDMPDQNSIATGAYSGDDRTWRTACRLDGSASFRELPAHVPFEAQLLRGREVVLRAGSLSLEPGEQREVVWRLNAGARLVGRVIDQHGAPVAHHALGRFPASFFTRGTEVERPALMEHMFEHAVEHASSDADGRFTLEDVAPGSWWIALRPGAQEPSEFSAVAVGVELPAGVAEQVVELRVDRGLYVGGRVETPAGAPADHGFVSARIEGISGTVDARVGTDGRFRVGPLPAGSCRLRAASYREHGRSSEVAAVAGEEDVLLRLTAGARLAGVVLDPRTGAGVAARIIVSPHDEHGLFYCPPTRPDGSFEQSGLEDGTYDLCAEVDDGRVAVLRELTVGAGATLDGLRLELATGARVDVRYAGELAYGGYRIRSDGIVVATGALKRGASQVHFVPPGSIEVRMRRADRSYETEHVLLGAGEEQRFVFGTD